MRIRRMNALFRVQGGLFRDVVKKVSIAVLIFVLGCILLMAGCMKRDSKKELVSKTITITDSVGRSVELPQPLEKVVLLNSYASDAICILNAQDTIIGVADVSIYQQKQCHGMQDKDLVGTWIHPSYEKIVELRPQVVISYDSLQIGEEHLEKLEPLGIKVVFIDCFKLETYDTDIKTLGKMFGKEKEAEAFLKWKVEKVTVLDRIKDLEPEKKVRVFTTPTNDFEKYEWSTYFSGSSVNQVIAMAGGINVAGELEGTGGKVSPEWILQQNPEILLVRPRDDMLGLETNDLTNAEKLKEQATKNKVLRHIDAVQNDRIYILPVRLLSCEKTFIGVLYLAKWFYPDQFQDLDPEKVLKEYFEKWMGVPFQGKWAYPPVS